MPAKVTIIRNLFLSFFVLLQAGVAAWAQADSTEATPYGHTRSLYFGIHAGVVRDFGKQANFFRGLNAFGIKELLEVPQVKSELQNRTGKNFYLNEYPSLMRYNISIGPGIDVLYDAGDINFILSATSCKLTTTGVFTLAATDPANPYGEPIIKTESIEGVERRTWLKAGVQFKNAIDERSDFLVELAPQLFFQKAVKNTLNIEGSTYSILVQNPGNVPVQTSYTGYGLSLGLGWQSRFIGNKLLQFGVNSSFSKLKMVSSKGLNLLVEANLSLFL